MMAMSIFDNFYEMDYNELFGSFTTTTISRMDYLTFGLTLLPIIVAFICGLIYLLKRKTKNDTMQRNGSKASQSSSTKSQKNDAIDSGKGQQPQQLEQAAKRKAKGGNNSNNNNSKRQEINQNQNQQQTQSQTQTQQKRTSGFLVDDWLFCYKKGMMSSSAEDETTSRHNPVHRNSTSSETGVSEDFNLSSSNEETSSSKTVVSTNKKSKKLRQKRQQQQQQQQLQRSNTSLSANEKQQQQRSSNKQQQNDSLVGDSGSTGKIKETGRNVNNNKNFNNKANLHNHHQQQQQEQQLMQQHQQNQQQQQNKSNSNLRKQCTKAAAVRAAAAVAASEKQFNFNPTITNNNGGFNKLKSSNSSTSLKNKAVINKGAGLSPASSSSSLSSTSSSNNSSPSNSPKNSPMPSPIAFKRANNYYKRYQQRSPTLCVLDYVVVDEQEFIRHLRRFVIDRNLLRIYGYPVESSVHEGCVEIFKCLPKHILQANAHLSNPANRHNNIINTHDGLYIKRRNRQEPETLGNTSTDSGRGSSDSSPASVDSDSSETGEDETNGITAFYTPDGIYQIFSQYDNSVEKQCVRCKSSFMVTNDGEYLSEEACFYHWGKLNPIYDGESVCGWQYNCCQGPEYSLGCCSHHLHVWTGAAVGLNGPYNDFVYTRRKPKAERGLTKAYALDCEMSYTGRGLEVTKITLVSHNGALVYETFVRPKAEIVDYNTRFSGITEEDLSINSNSTVKTLQEVQQDLLELIDADTLLIGHGLDNDLRVLRIVHKNVIDTSIAFPHASGFPFRRALRHLMKVFLNRDVQTGDKGHSSFEDSRACLELMMWKLRRELRINFFD